MKNKAQSIIEYAVLLGIVSAALIGMQLYMKRGIQAVVKASADELGGQEDSERELQKGTQQSSNTNTITTGAANDTPDLFKGESRRIRVVAGGGSRMDFETTANTTGTQTYESEQ